MKKIIVLTAIVAILGFLAGIAYAKKDVDKYTTYEIDDIIFECQADEKISIILNTELVDYFLVPSAVIDGRCVISTDLTDLGD